MSSGFLLISLLMVIFLMGCGSDDNLLKPKSPYILEVGSLDGPARVAVGDTLWVTLTDIILHDSCRQFLRLEEERNDSLQEVTVWGRVSGGYCRAVLTHYSMILPITNIGVGPFEVVVNQPDGSSLKLQVDVLAPPSIDLP